MPGGATAPDGKTLTIRLAPHDEWAEINSVVEGHFMERFSRSAYRKTMAEQKPKMLFQHGKDPEIGEKLIATTDEVGEDETSPYARGEILDGVPPLVVDGLRKGVYGASHRFSVVREEWAPKPKAGPHNPTGLPERTVIEARLYELGPVTWPAYAGASAALRSMTDEMRGAPPTEPEAPSLDAAAEEPHLEPERRDEPVIVVSTQLEDKQVADISLYPTRDEKVTRVGEIERELETLDSQYDGKLPDEPQARWDEYVAEKKQLLEAVDAIDARRRELGKTYRAQIIDDTLTGWAPPPVNVIKTRDLASIYDVQRVRRESRNEAQFASNMRDSAMRSVEGASFGNARFPKQSGQSDVAELLDGRDQCEPVEVAKRVLYTGNPAYRRAFRKHLLGQSFTAEEQASFEETRAALVTLSNVAVPYDLDTTMQINTAGAVNPYREAFRVVKTTSNDWRPMVSSGMTAVYIGEAVAPSDMSPSFTAPARLIQKAHTVATFSTEIQSDYPGLEAELAREISDAKDVLESVQFTTGAGSTIYPQGIFTAFTLNFLDTATTLVIVPKDLYALEANVGPRYRAGCVWLGSPYFYSLVRAIDTAGGAGLWVDNLTQGGAVGTFANNGRLGNLLGHPAYEVGGLPDGTMATTEKVAILANRERFVVIDRIGMNLELIPNFLDATTGFPTGQRMVYAWWRNTSVGIGLVTLGAGRAACIFRGK
jgi:HK97 family phage major capsid protein